MTRDPRVDAYIAKAQPFARPILDHVRSRVHAVVPDADEALKWGAPALTLDGKILLVLAAFKAHAAINFWRGREVRGEQSSEQGMGQFGKLCSLGDLPGDDELDRLIERAADLSRAAPTPRTAKPRPKADAPIHPDFAAALAGSPEARKTFDAFPPGARRDYLDWIAEAKRDITRAKRIDSAIEWLAEGKKRHWKYERC